MIQSVCHTSLSQLEGGLDTNKNHNKQMDCSEVHGNTASE